MSGRAEDVYFGSGKHDGSYASEYHAEWVGVTCHSHCSELVSLPLFTFEYHSNRNWRGDPLPEEIIKQKPNVILAADCVYFEPAFPLLLNTLEELLGLCAEAVVYFCFKKRRRADMQFMKSARKMFVVEEVKDEDRETFSREGLFLYTFRRKS